jgi:oligoendopeptidase F
MARWRRDKPLPRPTRSSDLKAMLALRYYQNTTDAERAKFLSDCQDKITNFTTPLVFYTLEINRIPDETLDALFSANADLARYKPIFERLRAMRPHQLSDELERFLHDQSVVGASAWNKLFDETMAGLTFDVNGEEHGIESTLNLLTDHDRAKREAAAHALARVFGENIRSSPGCTTRWPRRRKSKIAGARCRRRRPAGTSPTTWSPKSSRRCATRSSPPTPPVAPLLRAEARSGWASTRCRSGTATRRCRWRTRKRSTGTRAKDMVMRPMRVRSEDGRTRRAVLHRGWIDAGVKPGKAPGAFAHPTVTEVHPYVMLNYLGKPRDVMTLAHELGHGVHQVLAAGQGELLSSTPLTLAETASVFGEMLTFRKLLAGARTDAEKQGAAGGQGRGHDQHGRAPDRLLRFRVQAARRPPRQGELTPDDINALWMSVQAESLGPAFTFMPGYETFWAYIPHFVHSPFYVYAYAFGDGLVNALYAVYEEGDDGLPGEVFRDAQGRRIEAPQGPAGALRARRVRPEILGQGAVA